MFFFDAELSVRPADAQRPQSNPLAMYRSKITILPLWTNITIFKQNTANKYTGQKYENKLKFDLKDRLESHLSTFDILVCIGEYIYTCSAHTKHIVGLCIGVVPLTSPAYMHKHIAHALHTHTHSLGL